MEQEQAFAKLKDLIKYRLSRGEISRSDLDEIVMLSTVCKSQLSERFLSVVDGFDQKFITVNDVQMSFLARLDRIIEIGSEFPSTIQPLIIDDALLPTFHLPTKDKSRVLELCIDMRKIVFASDHFDEPHKRRLLDRIAAIEHQVHQPNGLFDVVRGGIDEVGETLGKFGKNIKPLTDRMAEVVQIVRRSTKQYDQLPAPEEIKKLPKPEDEA